MNSKLNHKPKSIHQHLTEISITQQSSQKLWTSVITILFWSLIQHPVIWVWQSTNRLNTPHCMNHLSTVNRFYSDRITDLTTVYYIIILVLEAAGYNDRCGSNWSKTANDVLGLLTYLNAVRVFFSRGVYLLMLHRNLKLCTFVNKLNFISKI